MNHITNNNFTDQNVNGNPAHSDSDANGLRTVNSTGRDNYNDDDDDEDDHEYSNNKDAGMDIAAGDLLAHWGL